MSGIEEKPIKKKEETPIWKKPSNMSFEEYMNMRMPGRRRERRRRARRGILLNSVLFVVNFCIMLWNLNAKGLGILGVGIFASVCIFLLWCIKCEFRTYVDNREVDMEEVSDVGR